MTKGTSHAGGDLPLAEFLYSICSAAAPGSAMKGGDVAQLQRLMALLHKLRIAHANAQAQAKVAAAPAAARAAADELPSAPTHRPR